MATPLSPVLNCTEFVAAEGRYELQQDIHLDQVLSHPTISTHVSVVSVKYKDYPGSIPGSKSSFHGKHASADSALTPANVDHLEERLRDVKMLDDDDDNTSGSRPNFSRNFQGSLIDIHPHSDDNGIGSGLRSPRSGIMSPGLPQVMTPGPPPLKDSSSNRVSDPSALFGPPPTPPHQPQQQQQSQQFGFKSLSRASSYYQQDDSGSGNSGGASNQPSTSAGFSSFFSGKRKKPKNNIAKTNSTFVAKITTHESLAKILANRVHEDVYFFWNTGRTFTWSEMNQKPNEPLSHISFSKAFPTSHDVNVLTRSCDHLDVIIGFSTGDIIWFDPLCNKYYRLNKQSVIKDSAVSMIKWLPGSETQFMVSFHDGSVLIMDKERDDNAFTPPTPPDDNLFHVTRPKHGKHNPISHWQVCKKPITAFAFSPDLQHVAVVSTDGGLRVIDFRHERLLDTFQAYFGALNCVCWSPDGKYILTGGQDDLVTIWSFKDQRIIARCQGHQSYVTGVAFDPWRCDEKNYRFGSVGEDAKLLLWDFSVSALHKPKAVRRGQSSNNQIYFYEGLFFDVLDWDEAVMQRRGSNATVLGATAGAGAGSNGFKPGHRSKGSIGSLRGIGGHSLFSGHHTTANNSGSSPALLHPSSPTGHHIQQHSSILEEPAGSEQSGSANGGIPDATSA
ncbi:hypothetical protein BGW38_002320, partial [Lunasporangiospora selenospora]